MSDEATTDLPIQSAFCAKCGRRLIVDSVVKWATYCAQNFTFLCHPSCAKPTPGDGLTVSERAVIDAAACRVVSDE